MWNADNGPSWKRFRFGIPLAEELLKELANQSEAGGDTAGFVSTQEHFLAAPRNMRGLQDSSLIQNAHVSLSRQAGSGHPRHFLKVRNTIPPRGLPACWRYGRQMRRPFKKSWNGY